MTAQHQPGPEDAVGDDQVFLFTGSLTDFWSHTQVRDYILTMPGITPTIMHTYMCLRSMVTAQSGGKPRRLTIDRLCWLVTPTGGKPVSHSKMYDHLRDLEALDLVVPDDTVHDTRRTYKTRKERAACGTLRGFIVRDLPPDAYTGWRHLWDKDDAYRPDWRENPPVPPSYQTVHGKVGDNGRRGPDRVRLVGADAEAFQKSGTPTPERDQFQKSGTPVQKSGTPVQKSGASKAPTRKNAPSNKAHEEVSLSGAAVDGQQQAVAPEREKAPQQDDKPQAPSDVPQQREGNSVVEQAVTQVIEAYFGASGFYPTRQVVAGLRHDTADLLGLGWPVEHIAKLAAQLPGKGYASLARHAQHNPPPAKKDSSTAGIAPWCGECEPPDSPDHRWLELEDGRMAKCSCHPNAARSLATV